MEAGANSVTHSVRENDRGLLAAGNPATIVQPLPLVVPFAGDFAQR